MSPELSAATAAAPASAAAQPAVGDDSVIRAV